MVPGLLKGMKYLNERFSRCLLVDTMSCCVTVAGSSNPPASVILVSRTIDATSHS